MDEKRNLTLAKRLAKAMGTELVPCGVDGWALGLRGFPAVGWRNGPDALRGGCGDAGLLDVGYTWGGRGLGLNLPAGITRDASDEEIDLILSAMGF